MRGVVAAVPLVAAGLTAAQPFLLRWGATRWIKWQAERYAKKLDRIAADENRITDERDRAKQRAATIRQRIQDAEYKTAMKALEGMDEAADEVEESAEEPTEESANSGES